jgi:hypothetical protein
VWESARDSFVQQNKETEERERYEKVLQMV